MKLSFLALITLACVQAAEQQPDIKANTYQPNHRSSHVDKIEMMKHSFEAPLSYDNTLSEWEMTGAAIPTKQHVVLTPQVANRTGHFWHKDAVKTNNFELTFNFKVEGPEFSKSEGFALWFVYEDFQKIKPSLPQGNPDWTLFGYKPNFKGLGVFFSTLDKDRRIKQGISAILNDGTKVYKSGANLPSDDNLFFKWKNTHEPLRFRLAVGPKGVLGQIQPHSNAPWINCFRMAGAKLDPNGYLGFSSYTGPEVGAPEKKGDRVQISSLHMYNLDLSITGEDSDVLHDTLAEFDVAAMLKQMSNFQTDHEKTLALKMLTSMLYKHIAEASPREQTIYKILNVLQNTVHKLISDVRELNKEMKSVTLSNSSDHVHALRTELTGLRTMFSKHSQQQSSTLTSLHRTVSSMSSTEAGESIHSREMSKLAAQARSLEATVKRNASYSTWLVFAIVFVVAGLVLTMWKRVRDMEKKHLL